MNTMTHNPLTLGVAAQHLGIAAWKVASTLDRGFFSEWFRVVSYRVSRPELVPALRDAVVRAG